MLLKTLHVLTKQCAKGWRYDESQCFFNTKLIFSLFMTINIWSLSILTFGKVRAFDFFRISDERRSWLEYLLPVGIFILLSLIYPKKKVFRIDESTINRKAVIRN